jgi:hypothetical protein
MTTRKTDPELDAMVTLQISVLCEMPSASAQEAARGLLDVMAREMVLRCLLISTSLPVGETMIRIGLEAPVRKKVIAHDPS